MSCRSRATIDCWIVPAMLIKASIVGASRSATEPRSSLVHMDAIRGPIARPFPVSLTRKRRLFVFVRHTGEEARLLHALQRLRRTL
jgi:hypothetical protein